MALILGDGFDHYPTALILNKWDVAGTGTGAVQTVNATYGRLGSQGVLLNGTINGGLIKNLPAANAAFGFLGAAVYVPSFTGYDRAIFAVGDSTTLYGSPVAGISLWLRADGSFGIRSWSGSVGFGSYLATSAPGMVAASTWNYMEMKVKSHLTTGSVEVRVNEVVKLTATGINTRGGCANDYFTRAWLGGSEGSSPTWNTTYFDDFYYCDDTGAVNNTYLGDVQLQAIYPDGAGSSTVWTKFGGATNWQSVNEHSPDDDTTYVKSAVVGDLDMYTMDNISATAVSIKGLLFNARIKKDDATARTYSTMVKDVSSGGATTVVATRTTPYGSYTNQQDVSELSPTTAAAWTKTEVDAMEAGIKVIT